MPIRTLLSSLVALTIVLALAGASPAWAGTYDVRTCSANSVADPPAALSGVDDAWTPESNDTGGLETLHQCPPADDTGSDGLVAETKLLGTAPGVGRFAQWRFDAPAATSVTRLRMWRYAG